MRNLGDMNDLYNAQDVVLLCKIVKNRFQYCMNSMVLILEGVILPAQSKVILVLLTSNESIEIFE